MDTTTTPMPRGRRRARAQSPNDAAAPAAANQAPEWGPFLHKQTLLCQGSHSAILTTLYIQTHAEPPSLYRTYYFGLILAMLAQFRLTNKLAALPKKGTASDTHILRFG